jgi:hypothetical protein
MGHFVGQSPFAPNSDVRSKPSVSPSVSPKAFLFPFGAPGDGLPCIRHRPVGIAGARHEFPLRVRAPQRGVRCMGNLLR